MKDCHSQKSLFAARLPAEYLYTPSHFWMAAGSAAGSWRVGLTEFAVRMLGELVVVEFEVKPGSAVEIGQAIGLVEGFKAVSDLFCVGTGTLAGTNPALNQGLEVLAEDPYGKGWLYEFAGIPDPRQLDVTAYRELLGVTVQRLQSDQCPEDAP